MRNQIPYTHSHGADWAADNIESPFIFLPLSIATGTALGTTGVPVVSNIAGCPSTFAVVDANSTADNNEGYWTSDDATDVDYIWPGAGYDYSESAEHPLFGLGACLMPAGTVDGVGGGVMLFACDLFIPTGATNAGGVAVFGTRDAAIDVDGYGFGVVPSTGAFNFANQDGLSIVQGDVMNASLTANSIVQRVAVLLDFKTGEILSARNGVAQTVAGKSTILAASDAKTLQGCGWTFSALNSSATPDARAVATSPQCRFRNMLIMDLTNYTNAQADFYELADRLHRAPSYSLPHWMDRF